MSIPPAKIAPSLLSADFAHLKGDMPTRLENPMQLQKNLPHRRLPLLKLLRHRQFHGTANGNSELER